ncbi:hypothetical protein [Jeongeupia sp. USM3]|uniref:hypothetical protein n=1 Tax=Jeongeupia sp. USM3 TaxID=1906741 RepID=UPI00089E07C9|nr:hypothetical protein [Jeongeupia sp. USM3]AOX99266.1 hypothetical protein BJP62_01640 [Jeongeupia sp. USM3]
MATLCALSLLTLGLTHFAHAQEQTSDSVLKPVPGVTFKHDEQRNNWTVAWKNKQYVLPNASWDTMTIHQIKDYGVSKLVLTSGSAGRACEQEYRLYLFAPNGEVDEWRDFKTCYAQKQSVQIKGDYITVNLDGKKTDLNPNEDAAARPNALR